MTRPLGREVLECFRSNGDLVRFDPKSEEFGIMATAGHILTFMILRPLPGSSQTSLQYFRSNCR